MTAPPDVAIVLHDLRGGGAERAMLRLAGGMAAEGRSVHLILVQRRGDYLADIPPAITVSDLGARSVAAAVFPLSRLLRQLKPRSVLSALTHMNLTTIVAARLAGVRGHVVVSERNQISEKAREGRSLRERATYFLAPRLYRLAEAVVPVSQGVADDLIRFAGLEPERVHVIYNPVFSEDLLERAQGLPDHPWLGDGGPPVILAVGRLHVQKDFQTLIQAFAGVLRTRPARLLIFGEGPERKTLEALVRQLGITDQVSMPGFTQNPLRAMRTAALVVLSSRWEGFPNVLVEAMATGAPVVATDCPSGPQEILEGGEYGALAPVGDVDAMTGAILATLDNPPDRARTQARASLYSVSAAARGYLDVLGV